jgi:hypothetical protein
MKRYLGDKPIPEAVEFRLQSTSMFHTPGMLLWAINGYKFAKDRPYLLKMWVEGYPGPAQAAYDALLRGQLPWSVDDENAVIFQGWKEKAA